MVRAEILIVGVVKVRVTLWLDEMVVLTNEDVWCTLSAFHQ